MPHSAAASFLLLFLTGCACLLEPRTVDTRGVYVEWSLEAVERLRQALNRGQCQAIYEEASEPFRRLESLDDWMADCAQIRNSLREWRSFSVPHVDARPGFEATSLESLPAASSDTPRTPS